MPGTRNRANYPGLMRLYSWKTSFYCPFTGPAQFLIAVRILMLTPQVTVTVIRPQRSYASLYSRQRPSQENHNCQNAENNGSWAGQF